MSASGDWVQFEQRLRDLLERQSRTASGRVQSRLRRARHAALAAAADRRASRLGWLAGRRLWVPAAGAAAVVAAWMMLVTPRHGMNPPFAGRRTVVTAQDMRLLTDRDGLALLREGDGEFYEWAAAQTDAEPLPEGGGDRPSKHGG